MLSRFNEISEEIEVDRTLDMLRELTNSGELDRKDFSIYIYGQGSQTRNFYRELKNNPDIELYWTGWSGPKFLWFLSFIPGQAGFLKIKEISKTYEIYEKVGEQSFCGLYFLPTKLEDNIKKRLKSDRGIFRIKEIITQDINDYFLIDIDFDYHGGERDGEIIYWNLTYGDGINDNLRKILRIDNNKNVP